jgi:hypothetical protein
MGAVWRPQEARWRSSGDAFPPARRAALRAYAASEMVATVDRRSTWARQTLRARSFRAAVVRAADGLALRPRCGSPGLDLAKSASFPSQALAVGLLKVLARAGANPAGVKDG